MRFIIYEQRETTVLRTNGGAGAIIKAALAAAEEAKDANYIRVETKEDRSAVIITTHVNGTDAAWITYNPEQLDELIRMLRSFRDGLGS